MSHSGGHICCVEGAPSDLDCTVPGCPLQKFALHGGRGLELFPAARHLHAVDVVAMMTQGSPLH